ncbi:pyruvate kinase [Thermoproteota archaeon]
MLKKTKIVCTIGPASLQIETLKQMVRAGMNCARINTAYGDFDRYRQVITNVREVADVPVMVDLKGPEIRLQTDKEHIVKKGEVLEAGFNGEPISFNHNFIYDMNVGDLVFIDNGKIKTSVTEKSDGSLRLLVENGGLVSDGKGVNIPNKKLSVPTISLRDLKIIDFVKEHDVEFLALSFTRNATDIAKLKSAAEGFKGAVISKIENLEGITNFNEILNATDAIMIARGDLGVEIEPERVPLFQKSLIRKCNQAGKTVVTATEMLESMMYQSNPTRAEVSDVANAILDGTDATMLSGETAIGDYPVEAVAMMTRIALETEKAAKSSVMDKGFVNISDTVSWSIQRICQSMPLTKIVTLTRSGYTAKMISRFKVQEPIIAVTPSSRVKSQLELVYGVVPVHYNYHKQEDRLLSVACALYYKKLLHIEDLVLFTAAFRTKMKHASNLIEIHPLKELLELKK